MSRLTKSEKRVLLKCLTMALAILLTTKKLGAW
jgi:hypothetical protein